MAGFVFVLFLFCFCFVFVLFLTPSAETGNCYRCTQILKMSLVLHAIYFADALMLLTCKVNMSFGLRAEAVV
jgi:hypothetical protein